MVVHHLAEGAEARAGADAYRRDRLDRGAGFDPDAVAEYDLRIRIERLQLDRSPGTVEKDVVAHLHRPGAHDEHAPPHARGASDPCAAPELPAREKHGLPPRPFRITPGAYCCCTWTGAPTLDGVPEAMTRYRFGVGPALWTIWRMGPSALTIA